MLSDSIFECVSELAYEVARYWSWSLPEVNDSHAYEDEYYDILIERLTPLYDMGGILDLGADDVLFENQPIPKEIKEKIEYHFTCMCLDAFEKESAAKEAVRKIALNSPLGN